MRDKINDNAVDLTVTSPPYDNLRTYESKLKWSEEIWQTVIKELYRVTKDGGVVVWVVGDATVDGSETGTSFRQALYFMECGFKLHDTMIYEKNGCSMPSSNRYLQSFEYMFIFAKGKPKTVALIKDRKNRYPYRWGKGRTQREPDGSLRQIKKDYNGNKYGARFNIWRFLTGKGYSTKDEIAYEHPAIFPEELAADHIKSWSNAGDVVFDPFMGSGTTGKAALLLNRHFVGIEVVEKYFDIAQQRLSIVSNDLFIN
jgi:site-specific DNA-methyltransferase (adenine-specific)